MKRLLSQAILDACNCFGNRIAISDVAQHWSYSFFADQIQSWANFLYSADAPSRIGFVLPNSAHYLAAMYGAVQAGKTPFLIDDALSDTEIRNLVRAARMDALLVSEARSHMGPTMGRKEQLRLVNVKISNVTVPLHPETVICRFTSGTSASPKCLEFSHEAVLDAARIWSSSNDLRKEDTILCLPGFYNGLAFNTSLTACFLSGSRLSIYRGWASPAQVLRHATQEKVTRLIGYPVFYQLLANSNLPLDAVPPSLRDFFSAASRLSDETRLRLYDTRGMTVINYYGVAEAGPVTTERRPDITRGNGTALQSCDIRVQQGMLQVRTPYLATRYLNEPGELECRITTDGFFLTSDMAEIESGQLFLGNRNSALLDVGGKKFPASDVTDALMALPGVTDAYVFGDAQADKGTRVFAAVAGPGPGDECGLRSQLANTIARYKIPQDIRILDSMPRNSAGKIDAVHVRSLFMKGTPEHV